VNINGTKSVNSAARSKLFIQRQHQAPQKLFLDQDRTTDSRSAFQANSEWLPLAR